MEMDLALGDIWVYLSTSPLLHLTLTVLAYLVGDWIFRRSGRFAGAQFVHFMLGPATAALQGGGASVPLYWRQYASGMIAPAAWRSA